MLLLLPYFLGLKLLHSKGHQGSINAGARRQAYTRALALGYTRFTHFSL